MQTHHFTTVEWRRCEICAKSELRAFFSSSSAYFLLLSFSFRVLSLFVFCHLSVHNGPHLRVESSSVRVTLGWRDTARDFSSLVSVLGGG